MPGAPVKFRAKPTRLLSGLPEIDRILAELPLAPANRIARKGLSVAVRLLARRMRAMVTGGGRDIKKALKGYVKKDKKSKLFVAKAGAVGKQPNDKQEAAAGAKHAKSGKRGVGITGRNIHWWLMGTRRREHDNTKKNTGRMPAHSLVKSAAAAGLSEALAEMEAKCREALAIELAKLGAKK
ncbi:MAG: hypothetical protein NT069_03625 [Planctomycetota bacterium]|nr:hypothetical protein [Planctomycetota bacterium]